MLHRSKRINMANTNVVVVGNSLTAPNGIGTPTWADYLKDKVLPLGATFSNFGVNGATTELLLGRQYTDHDPAYIQGKTNVLFFSEVSNGIANGFTVASELARVKNYCLNRRLKGYKVFTLTCYDRIQLGNPAIRNGVLAYNTLARQSYSSFSDGLIETWQIPALGNAQQFPDYVHPVGAPLDALATMVFNKLINLSR
jgi:hypothetical protein